MAKNGKKAPETQTEETKEKKAPNGAFLNNYPKSLLTERTSEKDGKENKFYSVRVNTDLSKDGWGSFPVNPGQVLPCTKKVAGSDERVEVDGKVNILLASDKDKERNYKLNVCKKIDKKTGEKTFEDVDVSFQDIIDGVQNHRNAYKEEQKAAKEREDASAGIESNEVEAEAQAGE